MGWAPRWRESPALLRARAVPRIVSQVNIPNRRPPVAPRRLPELRPLTPKPVPHLRLDGPRDGCLSYPERGSDSPVGLAGPPQLADSRVPRR